jgi:RNA polymerase sigma-70 factor (ECF subfamily)
MIVSFPVQAAWLAEAATRGREAWQEARISIPDDAFSRYLEERATKAPEGALLRVRELYLACACSDRAHTSDAVRERAIVTFEREHFGQVRRALVRMKIVPAAIDDALGSLRERLFTGDPCLLTNYSGRGDLGNWVRSVAVRATLKVARRDRLRAAADEPFEVPLVDAELVYLRTLHSEHLRDALRDAFLMLTTQKRNLLRLHYVDGLTIDALGRLHSIHRATAARRLETAREELVQHVRELLGERLRLTATGIDSLVRVAASDLGISLTRLLDTPPPHSPSE